MGDSVGKCEGATDGDGEGNEVGELLGEDDGAREGGADGVEVGDSVGKTDGLLLKVGVSDG